MHYDTNIIITSTKDGNKYFSKYEILRGLMEFDRREPDKTCSLWQKLATSLYHSQEIREALKVKK
jgi:hypothetical protein